MVKIWQRRGFIPLVVTLVAISIVPRIFSKQLSQVAEAIVPSGSGLRPPEGKTLCAKHLPHGMPATNQLIERDIYCLSANRNTKFADWVAYRLEVDTITGSADQERVWEPDPDLAASETLEPSDYDGAAKVLGTDRGHLAPLASFRGEDWQQVNYLSNIVPQRAALNRGAWKELEEHVRDLVRDHGEVFVITGPSYLEPFETLPNADERHQIPGGFWKVVMYGDKIESYYFGQDTPSDADFRLGRTRLEEVSAWSGLDLSFLLSPYQEGQVPDSIEQIF